MLDKTIKYVLDSNLSDKNKTRIIYALIVTNTIIKIFMLYYWIVK